MKKRILLLFCLIAMSVAVFSGCRCKPSSQAWYVQSFVGTETFANGVELTMAYSGVPSVRDPYGGMEENFVSIEFQLDTVTFSPGTGETLTGTYSFRHGALKTEFTVTLDNGESFSGKASSSGYGSTLSFTFRGNYYLFQDSPIDPRENYEQSFRELISSIRYWADNPEGDIPLLPCNISLAGDCLILQSEDGMTRMKLDDSVAVRCFYLDGENQLHSLTQITAGDCYFTEYETDQCTLVTIYYVDPEI